MKTIIYSAIITLFVALLLLAFIGSDANAQATDVSVVNMKDKAGVEYQNFRPEIWANSAALPSVTREGRLGFQTDYGKGAIWSGTEWLYFPVNEAADVIVDTTVEQPHEILVAGFNASVTFTQAAHIIADSSNDQVELQQAWDLAGTIPEQAEIVYQGDFYLHGTVYSSTGNVRHRGMGYAKWHRGIDNASMVFMDVLHDNLEFVGIDIDGHRSTYTNTNNDFFKTSSTVSGIENLKFIDMNFENCHDALSLGQDSDWRMLDCTFDNIGGDAIYTTGLRGLVQRCKFSNYLSTAYYDEGARNKLLDSYLLSGNSADPDIVFTGDFDGSAGNRGVVDNVEVYDSIGSHTINAFNHSDTKISNSTFIGSPTFVIRIGGNSTVSNCLIRGGSYGVRALAQTSITGNRIQNVLVDSILVDNGSSSEDDILIDGNFIENSGGDGIYVGSTTGSSQSCIITNNTVLDSADIGIGIRLFTYSAINSNVVKNVGSIGILVAKSGAFGSQFNSVIGNTLYDEDGTETGISVTGNLTTLYNWVSGNSVQGSWATQINTDNEGNFRSGNLIEGSEPEQRIIEVSGGAAHTIMRVSATAVPDADLDPLMANPYISGSSLAWKYKDATGTVFDLTLGTSGGGGGSDNDTLTTSGSDDVITNPIISDSDLQIVGDHDGDGTGSLTLRAGDGAGTNAPEISLDEPEGVRMWWGHTDVAGTDILALQLKQNDGLYIPMETAGVWTDTAAAMFWDDTANELKVNDGGANITIGPATGAGGVTVENSGTSLGSFTTLDFSTNLTAVDAGGGEATITGSAGGGGSVLDEITVKPNDSTNTGTADYTLDYTADDVELNQALAQAGEEGKAVRVLDGNVLLAADVYMGTSGLQLRGMGQGVTVIHKGYNGSSNVGAIRIDDQVASSKISNLLIADLTIDGSQSTYTESNGISITDSDNIENSRFDNLEIRNCDEAILFNINADGKNNYLTNCYIHNNTIGLFIQNFSIEGFYLINNKFESHTTASFQGRVENSVIRGNYFLASGGHAVRIDQGKNLTIDNNLFVSGGSSRLIYIGSNPNSEGIKITENILYWGASIGIEIEVEGTKIFDNTIIACGSYGVLLDSNNVDVSYNYFESVGGNAIRNEFKDDLNIIGNIIKSAKTGAINNRSGENVLISENIVESSASINAIEIDNFGGTPSTTIQNNHFDLPTANPINNTASNEPIYHNQVISTTAPVFSEGIQFGADSTDNLIDDESNGSNTATLYIGNAAISTAFTGAHYYICSATLVSIARNQGLKNLIGAAVSLDDNQEIVPTSGIQDQKCIGLFWGIPSWKDSLGRAQVIQATESVRQKPVIISATEALVTRDIIDETTQVIDTIVECEENAFGDVVCSTEIVYATNVEGQEEVLREGYNYYEPRGVYYKWLYTDAVRADNPSQPARLQDFARSVAVTGDSYEEHDKIPLQGAWVSTANGVVENGDYLTTGPQAGWLVRQNDDLVHTYTVGQARERIDTNTKNAYISIMR